MESELEQLFSGLKTVIEQLTERIRHLEGQTDMQQVIIGHLAAGTSEEARTEALIAIALFQSESAQNNPAYVRGVQAGSALFRNGQMP